MTDPTGFLSTARRSRPRRPVPERVADWHEVHQGQELLPIVGAQAGRCMDCGIPFCHNACPLANLIPEWNALAYRDDWDTAVERLHATNNFPEFTGRLCPAPCETGCVLAINADPVTIKDVERAIADHAWDAGLVRPLRPGKHTGFSVAVIGSGPAGLAAAQQLTRAGHDVEVLERADRLGGLLRYGIPEFKLEKRHIDRRIRQLRAEGTVFRTGVTVGVDVSADELMERHDAVIVATGAGAWRELPLAGRELAGVRQAMEYLPPANRVQQGDLAASPVSARGKDVVIVGGGDTAADCLGTVVRQGAASVVQLDIRPRPGTRRAGDEPWPVHPRVLSTSAAYEEGRVLSRRPGAPDVRVFSAATLRFEGDDTGHVTALRIADTDPGTRRPAPGTERVLPAQLVLLALGFTGPDTSDGLLAQLGLRLAPDGSFARGDDFAALTTDDAPAPSGPGEDGTGTREGGTGASRGGAGAPAGATAPSTDGAGAAAYGTAPPEGPATPPASGTGAPGSSPAPAEDATAERRTAGRPAVYVAGDAGRGQSLIVWAIAEGRSAAAAVHRRLTGEPDLPAPVRPCDRPMAA
ncbi:glutamate synthase subunit beta [Streptomyces sp. SL13]|uniref:Glutamate synthase subunit beta n=1 Tax=Streptantibioticus silvisoli TaxID=2705255 RepID=A0AA90HBH1_9ACTN|nr:glutamate synthase subunit beta [Streptantibioticus silvisoli]MDI5971722.1 glutamate synthase subunit beta [Streptantibioticus silvisoli]